MTRMSRQVNLRNRRMTRMSRLENLHSVRAFHHPAMACPHPAMAFLHHWDWEFRRVRQRHQTVERLSCNQPQLLSR
jgi:hypothetical protein